MTAEMELVVDAGGDVRCVYGEELDLRELGKLQITRASHVEPDRDGFWWADMGPVNGPVLGPYGSRSEALGAERGWLARQRPASTRLGSGLVIGNSNGNHQHLVAPDNRREVPFASCVLKQADTPRPQFALAAVAYADSGLPSHHENPLSVGCAMPATDPVRGESQEAPPCSLAHCRNIEWRCGRCKSL